MSSVNRVSYKWCYTQATELHGKILKERNTAITITARSLQN